MEVAQLNVRLGRSGRRGRGRGKGRGLGAGETGAPGVPRARDGTSGKWALSFTGLFCKREAGAADIRVRRTQAPGYSRPVRDHRGGARG